MLREIICCISFWNRSSKYSTS